MLPQKRRIPKALFPRNTRGGMHREGKYFSATIFSGKTGALTRCAVVVSGKVSKKAVVRNRTRRRAYEAIGQNLLKLKEGLIVVFYARALARNASSQEITEDIKYIIGGDR